MLMKRVVMCVCTVGRCVIMMLNKISLLLSFFLYEGITLYLCVEIVVWMIVCLY